MKRICGILFITLALTACATTKITPDTRNQLNQIQNQLKQQAVATIVDSCLLRSELGTSHIVGQQSRATASAFSSALAQEIQAQDIQVSKQLTPYICGYMPEQQLKEYDYRENAEDKRQEIQQFPILNIMSQQQFTPVQNAALLNLNQSINAMAAKNISNLKEKKPQTDLLDLSAIDVETLQTLTTSRYIFSVSVTGVDASFGRSFVTATVSAGVSLATMGAGSGIVAFMVPKEGTVYSLNLIDLQNKKVLWTKGGVVAGKLFSAKKHSVDVKSILDPLFDTNTLNK